MIGNQELHFLHKFFKFYQVESLKLFWGFIIKLNVEQFTYYLEALRIFFFKLLYNPKLGSSASKLFVILDRCLSIA